MRLSIFTGMVAAVIALSGATTASAQVSESLINRFGRWTGYGWGEGYHAYDACPSCKRGGHGAHRHNRAMYQPAPANFGPTMNAPVGPFVPDNDAHWPWFSTPRGKTLGPTPGNFPPRPSVRSLPSAEPIPETVSPLPAPLEESTDALPSLSPQAEARLYPLPPPPVAKAKSVLRSGRPAPRYPLAR
jgi:hypothetical protein